MCSSIELFRCRRAQRRQLGYSCPTNSVDQCVEKCCAVSSTGGDRHYCNVQWKVFGLDDRDANDSTHSEIVRPIIYFQLAIALHC